MKAYNSELLLFALVGVAGFLVDAGIVFALTRSAMMGPIPAQVLAFAVAVTATWLLNRRITFAHRASPHFLREWLHYMAANSAGAVITNGVYVLLVLSVAQTAREPVLALAAGALTGLAFNFTASRAWVFRPR